MNCHFSISSLGLVAWKGSGCENNTIKPTSFSLTWCSCAPATSRNFVVTGILEESGNPNVDRIVKINTNTGNSFFHKLGQYDVMQIM